MKIIKKYIRKLNNCNVTRKYIMLPIINLRDKGLDLINYSFISEGRNRVRQFRDIHKGQRCFIIGNGPSLIPEDLNLIKDEISFASNRIYDIYSYTEWKPTYYAVQDIYVLEEISEEIQKEENASLKRFIIGNRKKIISPQMLNDEKNIFYYLDFKISEFDSIKFSSDVAKKVHNGGTVTYMLLQLACYMGFKEIYLLGVDNNYGMLTDSEGRINTDLHVQNHFKQAKAYKKLRSNNIDPKDLTYISTKAYEAAQEYTDQNGIKIYNCTRGGKLEVFERVKLEDVIMSN